jgi:hypothetical protein
MTGEANAQARIRSWLGSGKPYQLLAAEIAAWAAGKERGTALPDNSEFGRDLDVTVGPTTYRRAKQFLVAQGVLSADDGAYQVALRLGGRSCHRRPAGRVGQWDMTDTSGHGDGLAVRLTVWVSRPAAGLRALAGERAHRSAWKSALRFRVRGGRDRGPARRRRRIRYSAWRPPPGSASCVTPRGTGAAGNGEPDSDLAVAQAARRASPHAARAAPAQADRHAWHPRHRHSADRLAPGAGRSRRHGSRPAGNHELRAAGRGSSRPC